MTKKTVLLISHVYPFPGATGQQQRVRSKLRALHESFHITFLTTASSNSVAETKQRLLEYCDEAIVLTSRYGQNRFEKSVRSLASLVYQLYTGLKRSNYRIGKVEFSLDRVQAIPGLERFDVVVYEYWHAVDTVCIFRNRGIPCVLDMHDILSKSYQRQLAHTHWLPNYWKSSALKRYEQHEYNAWKTFDALIAITDSEYKHVQALFPRKTLFYTPMGVDLKLWPYMWTPSAPARIAYYGGLGNPYNQREALRCYHHIMPHIWQIHPRTEFWIIGSNPSESLRELVRKDSRIHVPGFVEEIHSLLSTMTTVLCPFEGRFGFRSRLIEALALGVPIVATPDAVYGMGLETGGGVFLDDRNESLAQFCLSLIENNEFAHQQSLLARQQVEKNFSFEATYGKLAQDLYDFVSQNTSMAIL